MEDKIDNNKAAGLGNKGIFESQIHL